MDENAAAARALCEQQRFGSLATVAREPAGYPFASAVAYAIGPDGQPLFLFSGLAEHTQNVLADSRASLLVCEPSPAGKAVSPLALARATLVGDIERVPDGEIGAVRNAYVHLHPEAERYLELDFQFYRLRLRTVRFVGGFGRMSWIDPADFAAC